MATDALIASEITDAILEEIYRDLAEVPSPSAEAHDAEMAALAALPLAA